MKTAVVLFALALLSGCSKPSDDRGASAGLGGSAESIDYNEVDRAAEADIKAPNAAEARAWLRVPANAIFEGSKAEVVELTESFYRAGCPKVYITGIEKLGETFLSASMVVVLPSEAASRRAAIQVENAFSQKAGETGVQDKKQKYVLLTFD